MQGYSESILKDIGRSYVVSSLLPASLFVGVAVLLFKDFFVSNQQQQEWINNNEATLFAGIVLILIILSTWIGFILYSAQNFIIPLFEGYLLPQKIGNRKAKKKEALLKKKYRTQLERFYEAYTDYLASKKLKKTKQNKTALGNSYEMVQKAFRDSGLDYSIPIVHQDEQTVSAYKSYEDLIDFSAILPTRLGNMLRAGEIYPRQRYGFDGTNIWTRLWAVLPENYSSQLEESNNRLIFLLNSSFLAIIILLFNLVVAIGSAIMAAIEFLNPLTHFWFEVSCYLYKATILNRPFYYWIRPLSPNIAYDLVVQSLWYLIFSILSIFIAYGLYYFGVKAAEDFSHLVQSAYDLYRTDLLEQLHIPLPNTIEKEKEIWQQLDVFWGKSGPLFPSPKIRFQHPPPKTTNQDQNAKS